MIGTGGVTAGNVAKRLLELTLEPPETGHVYAAQAEFEGGRLAPVFEKLLEGWHAQGYELTSLHDYLESLATRDLPPHEISAGPVPGRLGALALQGRAFLAGA